MILVISTEGTEGVWEMWHSRMQISLHERAGHSAKTWEDKYKTEQCTRHAEAYGRLPSDKRDLSIEEALRL